MGKVGKAVGSGLSAVSKVAGYIPGVGGLASGLLGAAGNALQGNWGQAGSALKSGLSGLGDNPLLTASLLGKLGVPGFKGIDSPQALPDPRAGVLGQFSGLLGNALNGGQSIGSILSQAGALPAYTGQLTAGLTPDQQSIIGGINGSFAQFMAGDRGQSALTGISDIAKSGQNLNLPPEIAAILNNIPGQGILSSIAGGNDATTQQLRNLFASAPQDVIAARGLTGTQANAGLDQLLGLTNFRSGEEGALAQSGYNVDTQIPDMLKQLAGSVNDPFIAALAASGGSDNPAIAGLLGAAGGTGNPAQDLLLQRAQMDPTRRIQMQLAQAGGYDPTAGAQGSLDAAQGLLSQLFSTGSDVLSGLIGGNNLSDIASTLDTTRQQALAEDTANLRELFSSQGLRQSTDLAQAVSNLQAKSQSDYMSQLAQLAPQLAGLNISGTTSGLGSLASIAGAIGGLGQTAGQLGLGAQSNQLGALQTAGQLGLGAYGQQLGALGQSGQLGIGELGTIINALQGAGSLTQGQQGLLQSGLGAASGAYLNQNSLIGQLLANSGNIDASQVGLMQSGLNLAGQLGLSANAQNVQAAQSAAQVAQDEINRRSQLSGLLAQLGVTSQGQQSSALQAILGNQLSAASTLGSQGLQSAGLMSNLFQSQQANALQAALALPGATSMIAQLPGVLGQQAYNLSEAGRQVADTSLQRQYQEFQRQQSLTPQLLSFLSNTPGTTYGPSTLSQVTQAAVGGAGLKNIKGGSGGSAQAGTSGGGNIQGTPAPGVVNASLNVPQLTLPGQVNLTNQIPGLRNVPSLLSGLGARFNLMSGMPNQLTNRLLLG